MVANMKDLSRAAANLDALAYRIRICRQFEDEPETYRAEMIFTWRDLEWIETARDYLKIGIDNASGLG